MNTIHPYESQYLLWQSVQWKFSFMFCGESWPSRDRPTLKWTSSKHLKFLSGPVVGWSRFLLTGVGLWWLPKCKKDYHMLHYQYGTKRSIRNGEQRRRLLNMAKSVDYNSEILTTSCCTIIDISTQNSTFMRSWRCPPSSSCLGECFPAKPAGRCFHKDCIAGRCCQSCWSFHWSCRCCTPRYRAAQICSWQCCRLKLNRNLQMRSQRCRCSPHCSSVHVCSWQYCQSGSCRWCRRCRWCRSCPNQTALTSLGNFPQLASTCCLCRSPLAGSFLNPIHCTGRCGGEGWSRPGSSKRARTGWTWHCAACPGKEIVNQHNTRVPQCCLPCQMEFFVLFLFLFMFDNIF